MKEKRDEIEDAWKKEIKDPNSKIDDLVDDKRCLKNALELMKHIDIVIRKTKNFLYKELKDIETDEDIDDSTAEKIEDIRKKDLQVGGSLFENYVDKAKKALANQQNEVYSKIFVDLPNSLQALSILYRTAINITEERYMSIPSSPVMGQMVTAWSQILSTIGGGTTTSAKNVRKDLKEQLGGVVTSFFNSNSFLTESLIKSLLLDLAGLWGKLGDSVDDLLGIDAAIHKVMSGHHLVGRYYGRRRKGEGTKKYIKRKLNCFAGYWFGEDVEAGE
ncbi:MAG: hypothetical protein GWO20_01950 [Candidatus Korarchaeota archaeon]|nr:hypothetical protein [Candidatus Korarchaeota archaeon]NIU82282.1 hypothetical protein [Candidatus Thorarchaeota archaeon]NIW12736.1 hypothetical protein [Candidatus Thorarchaeota archaeon]NIW50947.1 hypothetical protein [Candidatus Korarchaeota archaeon]